MNGVSDDIDALAGEYVLGLQTSEERAAFELRLLDDHVLRAAVSGWRSRLEELDTVADRLEPRPALWQRIEAALPASAGQQERDARARGNSGLWHHLGFWRGFGISGALASGALAIALAVAVIRPQPQPIVVAIMQGEQSDATANVIVEAFDDGSIRVVPLGDLAAPEGRTLQVWTLWDRQRGPVSMGLMGRALQTSNYHADGLPTPQPEQLYEISLEPEGGSPTGRPTGPILFKGAAVRPS